MKTVALLSGLALTLTAGAAAAETSATCILHSGPLAGHTITLNHPKSVGDTCIDGKGSEGEVVAPSEHSAQPNGVNDTKRRNGAEITPDGVNDTIRKN